MDNGSVWMFLSICALIQLCILGFFMISMGNLVAAARAIETHTQKATVLLTVLANKQGATDEDVKTAMGR
ncbi:hypothetical protein JST97_25555 [bacterium]|nr:hypothetical protein [bacterium]